MTAKSTVEISPIVRTSAGLREAIFEEIDNVRRGTSNPTRANAVAKLAMSVVETVRMELEVKRFVHSNGGQIDKEMETEETRKKLLDGPLPLGNT